MKCKNCGHLVWVAEKGNDGNEIYRHKQSNHSVYCPCRQPEA